jgi:transposase
MLNMPMDDALWARIETALGVGRNVIAGGRRPLDNRSVLSGILLVLATGIPWERLPTGLGFGSGMTCLRRLRRWQREGKWTAVRDILIAYLPHADRITWWRAETGGATVRAVMRRKAKEHVHPPSPQQPE